MRGLLIDPITRTISELDREDDSLIGEIIMAVTGMVEVVPLTKSHDLWIDEEGRCVYPHPCGYFEISGQVFAGRGLVLGVDREGGCKGATWSAERLENLVRWIDTPPAEDVEPQITVQEW